MQVFVQEPACRQAGAAIENKSQCWEAVRLSSASFLTRFSYKGIMSHNILKNPHNYHLSPFISWYLRTFGILYKKYCATQNTFVGHRILYYCFKSCTTRAGALPALRFVINHFVLEQIGCTARPDGFPARQFTTNRCALG